MTTNAFEQAAIPTAIVVVKAIQTFVSNLGGDPAEVVAKLPGALQVLGGTLEMQLPAFGSAEWGAVQTDVSAKLVAMLTKLQAAHTST